jgi:3-hydroxybutyryl-CoA dehydratase
MFGSDQGPPSLTVGARARLTREISELDIKTMAEITGDSNPVHVDEAFAAKTRFGGRIAHGVLSAGLISAVIGTRLPGPGSIYLSQTLNFHLPVRPGDIITAEVEVTRWRPDKKIVHLATRCFNQEGEDVVAGEAVVFVEAVT